MSYWPLNIRYCQNCRGSPDRLRYGGRGLCHRCCYLTRRLETAEKWAFKQPDSSGRFMPAAYRGLFNNSYQRHEFDVFKNAYIKWIKRELITLRRRERFREGGVSPLILEYKFAAVLKLLNPKASQPGNASFLGHHFDKKQRGVIYSLLDDMINASIRNSDKDGFVSAFDAVHGLHL